MASVRTRFAPSPTGFMHIGGVRTALFAWLWARKHGEEGAFILRIEDTDTKREEDGAAAHIIESLDWLGLDRDEGPVAGGSYGPYKQSEKLERYKQLTQKLIDGGKAYVDASTPEQVDAWRKAAQAEKRAFLFREHRDDAMTDEAWDGTKPVRLKIENIERTTWNDAVRGELSAGEEALDDFIIMKADGYPTYNFAHVVDDADMEITHVVRGEEFIASVPKFIALHKALGFTVPEFVTVPHILNANGGKKLSKRDGARDALEYRDEGYDPEVIKNFLASLGWNDGTEKEIYTTDELIEAFDISRIQKSGAKFDETKLDWMAWQHTRMQIDESSDLSGFFEQHGISTDKQSPDFAAIVAEKARGIDDFLDQYKIYSESPSISVADFDLSIVDKNLTVELARQYIESTLEVLDATDTSNQEAVEQALRANMEKLEASPRAYLNLIRWAITDSKVSPNLFAMITLIGKNEIISRLKRAL